MNKTCKILITSRKERVIVKNQAVINILDVLRETLEIDERWILYDSGQESFRLTKKIEKNYIFFEEYGTDNILKILEKENPDIIIVSNDFEFFGRSFILAAEYKKIPVVLLQQKFLPVTNFDKQSGSNIKARIAILKNRGKFILKKYSILVKTYHYTKIHFTKIFIKIFQDLYESLFTTERNGMYVNDLILVISKDSKEHYMRKGINTKIVITGDPALDTTYKKIKHMNLEINNNSKIKILLLTTGYLEHGVWTFAMWENVMKILFLFMEKNSIEINFTVKIHPVTERRDKYKKLMQKIGTKFDIFQTEDLVELISDSDIVISLGTGSWATVEAILIKKPVITFNYFNLPKNQLPFVESGVAKEIRNIEELLPVIHKLKNDFKESNYDFFISKYLYKFDGKSSERSAVAIIEMLKQFGKIS